MIDPMKKVTLVGPGACAQRLIGQLHDLGTVEVLTASEQHGDADGALAAHAAATAECDEHLLKINAILHLLDQFAPVQKGFFQGLTPLPEIIDPQELQRAMRELDLDATYRNSQQLEEAYRVAERSIADIQSQLETLRPFAQFDFSLDRVHALKHTCLTLAWLSAKSQETLDQHPAAGDTLVWEGLTQGERALFAFAYLPVNEEAARKLLAEIGAASVELPAVAGTAQDRIRALEEDLAATQERKERVVRDASAMAAMRRQLLHLKALWESNRRKEMALGRALSGKWTFMLLGYTRATDLGRLEALLHHHFPEVSLAVEDPAPEENVSVSITLPAWLKPVQLLVNMFGLPNYGSFDPSPFLMVNFFVFFGICFGDVGYGLMLLALSTYLMSKTREYAGVRNFARVFMYASFTTIFFGALMGAWFGDLYKVEYLGQANLLLVLQSRLAVFDPMAKPIIGLMIALSIGVLNQFYGIALKMYGAVLRRDYATAVCDGLLWLITLPGMLILVATVFVSVPPALVTVGGAMMGGGALGLVFTQGRNEKSLAGKVITGIISIYGIVGSYGCTAFIGDMLSYCRLLALGLTTSIVAMSINLMAGMLRETPYVGFVLFLALLIFGHIFNFLISVLGAFVHSVRLIFVEFFGRFYTGGARPFSPLQFDSRAFIMRKSA